MKIMFDAFAATVRAIPAWTAGDQWNIALGVFQGGVAVLPPDSMIAFCYNNASAIPAQIETIGDKFTTSGELINALKAVQDLMK
jgi:hypothetical protein